MTYRPIFLTFFPIVTLTIFVQLSKTPLGMVSNASGNTKAPEMFVQFLKAVPSNLVTPIPNDNFCNPEHPINAPVLI